MCSDVVKKKRTLCTLVVFKVSLRERNENWAESLLGSQWLALDQPARETSALPGSMPMSSALAARARERRRNGYPSTLAPGFYRCYIGMYRWYGKENGNYQNCFRLPISSLP